MTKVIAVYTALNFLFFLVFFYWGFFLALKGERVRPTVWAIAGLISLFLCWWGLSMIEGKL